MSDSAQPYCLMKQHEGTFPFRGFKTWYCIYGDGEASGKLPLICAHGGPGAPHDYLQPFQAIAETGRRVILYDQLGCGNSDKPDTPELWTVPIFVEELGVLRQALGLGQTHLLGQSWGGMLAMEYMLTQPAGIAGLIIESSPSSIPMWVAEAGRLREQLPRDINAALLKHEEAGTTTDPEYLEATAMFYARHVCRINPLPEYVQRSFDNIGQPYFVMNGPSEFHVIGSLKDWDVTPRLGEITAQKATLFMSGRHDECTPLIANTVASGIPGCRLIIWEDSSHLCHVEQTDAVMKAVASFLDEVESR